MTALELPGRYREYSTAALTPPGTSFMTAGAGFNCKAVYSLPSLPTRVLPIHMYQLFFFAVPRSRLIHALCTPSACRKGGRGKRVRKLREPLCFNSVFRLFQPPQRFGSASGKPGVRDTGAVAQRGECSSARHRSPRPAASARRRPSARPRTGSRAPAIRLLRDGDLFQVGVGRQGQATHTQPADLREPDAARLDAHLAADERERVGPLVPALNFREILCGPLCPWRKSFNALVEFLYRHLRGAVRQTGKSRVAFLQASVGSRADISL